MPPERDTRGLEGGTVSYAFDTREATARLSLSARKIGALVADNAIPSFVVGRRRLFRPAEIEAWLDLGAPTTPGSAIKVRQHIERKGAAR